MRINQNNPVNHFVLDIRVNPVYNMPTQELTRLTRMKGLIFISSPNKTTVKVIGLGKRMTAKDKKGNDFEFVPVSIAFRSENVAGFHAETINVSPSKIPPTLTVGEEIPMELSRFRGRMRIRSIG